MTNHQWETGDIVKSVVKTEQDNEPTIFSPTGKIVSLPPEDREQITPGALITIQLEGKRQKQDGTGWYWHGNLQRIIYTADQLQTHVNDLTRQTREHIQDGTPPSAHEKLDEILQILRNTADTSTEQPTENTEQEQEPIDFIGRHFTAEVKQSGNDYILRPTDNHKRETLSETRPNMVITATHSDTVMMANVQKQPAASGDIYIPKTNKYAFEGAEGEEVQVEINKYLN